MEDNKLETDDWAGDRLGYEKIGHAFTNLVQSIDTEKVISIEAGFGRGKTFFRKAWAQQLKSAGETVVEIDVQQSDHSGDPVITVLGALVGALPKAKKSKGQKALSTAKNMGAIGTKAVTRAILKSGADEVIGAITDSAIDQLEDFDQLDAIIKDVGSEISKVAGQLIAAQMAGEKVRTVELPAQLDALRSALVGEEKHGRVVVIIDELDRCHPDYAIAFLEATKLIFGHSGFVFCLMVNANYLENLARHRFGVANEDEKYLDKFVDIRLKLEPKPDEFKSAVYDLASDLPLRIPYGDGEEFSIEKTAELASILADRCGFSMRKTKRILLKVEVALRCYSDRPLDAPLLVFMAFMDEKPDSVKQSDLPRSFLTPEEGKNIVNLGNRSGRRGMDIDSPRADVARDRERNEIINGNAPELLNLPKERYDNPENRNFKPWALAGLALAPHYIPSHRSVLDGIASVLVEKELEKEE